jgi:hypothetical protein
MKIFKKHGSKGKLFEMMERVNKIKLNESFDSPKAKDEKYLNKGGDINAINAQPNKFDDGYREPRERDIQVKDPSLEKLKGDDEPIEEGNWFTDSFNDAFPKTTSYRSQAMKGSPTGMGSTNDQKTVKANDIKEKYINLKREVGINQLAKSLANEYKKLTGYDIESQHNIDPQMQDSYMPEAEDKEEFISSEIGSETPENAVDVMAVAENGYDDNIEGGLADDKTPDEFDPKQILLGMEVELEHTNDPREALEIAMDHLVEDPEYYGNGEVDPDKQAQCNAEKDASEIQDDEFETEDGEESSENIEDDDLRVNMNWLETIKPKKVEDIGI